MKRLGVIGSLVWDTIYGRDPAQPAVQEWGGISYSLAGFDAALGPDWEIVPLVKVGRDLAARANRFLRSLHHVAPGARFLEVPEPNNRVTLRYYVNFISGYEMTLETAQFLRRGFRKFLYADLHSLFFDKEPDGTRVLRPLPDAPAWSGCFDVVQVNEDEMKQLGDDPLEVAAGVLARGCQTLVVTLAAKGAVYFTGQPVRTARIPAESGPPFEEGDPTGCGDVFGAAVTASLVAGMPLEAALRRGTQMAARNVTHRGATGLRDHLLGRLSSV